VTGFRDTLCDTQPVSELTESDEVFAVEVPPVCSGDLVAAVVVNIDTSSSLRFVLCLMRETRQCWRIIIIIIIIMVIVKTLVLCTNLGKLESEALV